MVVVGQGEKLSLWVGADAGEVVFRRCFEQRKGELFFFGCEISADVPFLIENNKVCAEI